MSGRYRIIKKRENRIRQRSREKEELFVADYIKQKYPDIYDEALQVYRLLVKNHPDKVDIRKTAEHKTWKIMKAATIHPAFNMQEPTSIPALAQMRICFSQQSIETLTTEPSTTEPTTTSEPSTIEPTITSEPSTIEPTITSEPSTPEPTTTSEPSTIEPTITPETSPEPPIPPKSKGKTMYSDNLQLIIPLLKSPIKHRGLISETLQIVTEETLQEEEEEQQQQQQHLNIDQIDPKIMEQVIDELRSDPNLKDLFADVECQFEQGMDLDIDIDIGIDTRLEDEIENWEIW